MRDVRFKPKIAMTDTDAPERGALLNVWPLIYKLLSIFHVTQCWKKKRGKFLGSAGKGGCDRIAQGCQQNERRHPLESVIFRLVSHFDLMVEAPQKSHRGLSISWAPAASLKVISNAVEFCAYFAKQWLPPAILNSWCMSSWHTASSITGIPLELIPTLNNHLKGSKLYLKRHAMGGIQLPRWARLDVAVVWGAQQDADIGAIYLLSKHDFILVSCTENTVVVRVRSQVAPGHTYLCYLFPTRIPTCDCSRCALWLHLKQSLARHARIVATLQAEILRISHNLGDLNSDVDPDAEVVVPEGKLLADLAQFADWEQLLASRVGRQEQDHPVQGLQGLKRKRTGREVVMIPVEGQKEARKDSYNAYAG
ncbi:hypothetical protein BDK51DRAFT_53156 [Blyttiomyces helicus]|uniref:Uncharacterized protein n=1 Tax=Blyttiomyces helicus TaxID=388810 RepID=A0A4P9WK79_9FUNG|nr:hypothetical protein BDK51DRAFT_53156 [Blyttiomyces helicus]|eukprot:RKO93371.1 hypothetical protein BDK51DRAFT_53156 [Blyttiomyces helicus]